MSEREVKRRTRELIGQWATAEFGLSKDELVEDWARERALLETERDGLALRVKRLEGYFASPGAKRLGVGPDPK